VPPPLPRSVAIVGAGYAGMAAAVELADRGHAVVVYEAGPRLGGRARTVRHAGLDLDNGLHLLIGAYAQTLALMRRVGVDPGAALLRLPLDWRVGNSLRVRALALPSPLHLAGGLLFARGPSLAERIACLGFLHRLERDGFRLARDTTVADLLASHRQSGVLVEQFWSPLCLAALNTPAERASAQVFLNVLRDSLAAGRSASELLLARKSLSELLPDPAARYVEARGGHVLPTTRAIGVVRDGDGLRVLTRSGAHEHAQVVIATAPFSVPAIARSLPGFAPTLATIERLDYEPITTIWLQYPHGPATPFPMLGLTEGPGQWLFDRGTICGQSGLVAVVISARGDYQAITHGELAARVHAQIARVLPGLPAAPLWSRVFEEKRATFACVPNLDRPDHATQVPGLWLAGDYTRGDYPSTIEGAVRSGLACAVRVAAALN